MNRLKPAYKGTRTHTAYAGTRDRPVNVRSVACPVCGVAAGQSCTGIVHNHHRPRRVMALRAERLVTA